MPHGIPLRQTLDEWLDEQIALAEEAEPKEANADSKTLGYYQGRAAAFFEVRLKVKELWH